MECTLATLIACFGWSSLYLDAGAGYTEGGSYRVDSYEFEFDYRNVSSGVHESGGFQTRAKTELGGFRYGRATLGYEINVSNVRLSLDGSIARNIDSGRNGTMKSIGLSARWFLFR